VRPLLTIPVLLCCAAVAASQTRCPVVADSLSGAPLANASIFDRKGRFIGMSRADGAASCATEADYPITIRYMGYHEKSVSSPWSADTVLLRESVAELPEFVVTEKQKKLLHILAYVREYSTLSSYTDTVTLFREKMVDFMLPDDNKLRFKGWRHPRVLNSRSYYRFSNAAGLDSVSDRCNQHFSWGDWVGFPPSVSVPAGVSASAGSPVEIHGKYGVSETWRMQADGRMDVDVDVMADSACRRWAPGMQSFFGNANIDFERFRMRVNYRDVGAGPAGPVDLSGYSFNIESRGRGHGMFRFHRVDEPFFVTTYTELYVLDREYIGVKEAKKWDRCGFDSYDMEIYEPMEAPALQPSVQALVDRVNNIDAARVRTDLRPDERLVGRHVNKRNFNIGYRALSMLKQLTGITLYKSHKNFNRNWRELPRSKPLK